MLHSVKLPNALHSTLPSTLWSTLLIALDCTLPAYLTYAPTKALKTLPSTQWVRFQLHLRVRFQVNSRACSQWHSHLPSTVHSQPAWLHTPNPALKRLSRTLPSTVSITLQIALNDSLLAYLTIRSQESKRLPSTPSMFSSTLPGMLPWTLTLALHGTQPACLTVHYQTSAQGALKHTPGHALKYASNYTRWYTPSPLGSTLPSTLSSGKTLPISLDYMLTCTILHARSRDLLSCRSQAPGGVSCRHQAPGGMRQVAYVGQWLVGGMWQVVCGTWWAAYDGWIMTSVDIIVWTLSSARPPWQDPTIPLCCGVDNRSIRFRSKGRQLELGESRSPIEIFQRNLVPAPNWLWPYVRSFGLGLMEMMAMAMANAKAMALAMVLVILIIVPEVLIQVGWLHQCQHQSFHRLWAL